jgi:hypothetical protein
MYIPTVHDKFFALKIKTFYFLFKGEFGIWIIYLLAEFRMQMHKEFREIPRSSGNFYCKKYRAIPYVFQKIPYSVGSQKRTSVDTLVAGETFQHNCDLFLFNVLIS